MKQEILEQKVDAFPRRVAPLTGLERKAFVDVHIRHAMGAGNYTEVNAVGNVVLRNYGIQGDTNYQISIFSIGHGLFVTLDGMNPDDPYGDDLSASFCINQDGAETPLSSQQQIFIDTALRYLSNINPNFLGYFKDDVPEDKIDGEDQDNDYAAA